MIHEYKRTIVVQCVVGEMATNCYIVADKITRSCVIIDPGESPEYISDKIIALHLQPSGIVATHGHFDHILGAFALQKAFAIPFFMHRNDEFLLSIMEKSARRFLSHNVFDPPPQEISFLEEGVPIKIGAMNLQVIRTAGHTPGSISLQQVYDHLFFVGDLMFSDGHVGRTDFAYSDRSALEISIQRILSESENHIIFSGHGDVTTLGNERAFHVY